MRIVLKNRVSLYIEKINAYITFVRFVICKISFMMIFFLFDVGQKFDYRIRNLKNSMRSTIVQFSFISLLFFKLRAHLQLNILIRRP